MRTRLYRTTLLALYQTCIALGIFMLPIALLAKQAGVSIPIHRLIATVGNAYEHALESSE